MSDPSPSMFRELGDGWAMRRLKYLATLNDEVIPEGTDPSMEIEYIEIADVTLTGGVERNAVMEFDGAPSRARRRVRGGDVLVSTVRTYLKAIAAIPKASENLVASTGFCVVRPGSDIEPRYMGWVAKSEPFVSEIVSRSVGVSYPAIKPSEVGTLAVPLPDRKAQERIAKYLDERTARIDGLIARKERLLELLAEKRQALITRAVTKGLDPDAPMKHSGIGWLGDIPAHWEVKRLKHLRQFVTSGSRGWASYYSNSGSTFLRMTNVTKIGVEINETDLRFVDVSDVTEGTRTALVPGDILITITAELGAVAIAREKHRGAFINQHLALFRADVRQVYPDFLANFLTSDAGRHQFVVRGNGGTKQGLGFEQVNELLVILPPIGEQDAIVHMLNAQERRHQDASEAIGEGISLLHEYRSALITAAVTGQLDVTGEAA